MQNSQNLLIDTKQSLIVSDRDSLRFDNLFNVMSFADAFFCGLPMLTHKFDSNRCTIKHPSGHQRRPTTHERAKSMTMHATAVCHLRLQTLMSS